MHKAKIFLFLALLSIILSSTALGNDYFLFDMENNKIWFMDHNSINFEEKLEMEKNPNFIMKTIDPQKYLTVFVPESEKVKGNREKKYTAGQLTVFNVASGRTEDVVEIGFSPLRWAYTEDRKHFFISYKVEPNKDIYEILHYDIPNMKTEKINSEPVNGFGFSYDEQTVYALITGKPADKIPGKIVAYNFSPLKEQHQIDTVNNPQKLYAVGPAQLVVLDYDNPPLFNRQACSGAIKLLRSDDLSLIEEDTFEKPYQISPNWYADKHLLIVAVNDKFTSLLAKNRKSLVYKVDANGLKQNKLETRWVDCDYIEDKDTVYLLKERSLQVIDYRNNLAKEVETNSNVYSSSSGNTSYYNFMLLPDSHLAVMYCVAGGRVRFFDTNTNELIKDVTFGRTGVKVAQGVFNLLLNAAANYGSYSYSYYNYFPTELSVSTDPDKTKFYILNTATGDITVYNNSYDRLTYLIPPETPLGMYSIKKPKIQTLVTTKQKIYRLDYTTGALEEIYKFKEPVRDTNLFEDNNRLILLSNNELITIDPATLQIKNSFQLFGDAKEKYTKLKKGQPHFYFIPSL